jgi:hypothetical protein
MHQSKIMKWSVILGIMIVLNLFFNYALSLAYHSPEYQNFCPMKSVITEITDSPSCTAVGGQWSPNIYYPGKIDPGMTQPKGYCDQEFTCRTNYETALKNYEKNVFVSLVVLGVISILISIFVVGGGEVLSLSLSLGGLLSLVIASIRYWSSAGELLKVIILGIALATLIWLAVKKFKDNI